MAASAREDIDLLEHGRLIYTTRCTACHNAERVGRWSPSEWAGIISRMAVEARLNDAQERAVRAYVMALAKSGG
jgi:mono/diheme cytochrome c family protein